MADTVIVYAKTQPDKGSKGITAFIVEKGMPVRRPIHVIAGLRWSCWVTRPGHAPSSRRSSFMG